MTTRDWHYKLNEAIERIRSRYQHIGRKTGAPFLAIVYPPEAELAVLKEWHTLVNSLRPEFDGKRVDVLAITQQVLEEIGADNIVGSLVDPMPGSDPASDLGQMWVQRVVAEVLESSRTVRGKPFVSIERVSALFPASGPRDLMQHLWDNPDTSLECPVVLLIPGSPRGARSYRFVDVQDEFMYRGDVL